MKKNASHITNVWLRSALKITVMVKFILILIVITSTQSFSRSYSQTKITINIKDFSLKNAFNEIEKKSDYHFLYNDDLMPGDLQISLNLKNASIDDVMFKILANTSLKYKLSTHNLVIVSTKSSNEDEYPVSGTVVDAKGEPIPGVTVKLKNTNNASVTDINGHYALKLNKNDGTLVFSFIGYTTQEVAINQRSQINITLVENQKSLNEVVVVGYGTQIRQNVTGSISSISQKDIKDLPVTNIGQALEGKIPGLQAQQTSGAPGASPNFRIRGLGSLLAGNGPLIVLDGQALNSGDLSLINPGDIESVDVLKDASATAIYGSRGSNGVILITTKRGKAGTSKIDFKYYTGVQDVTKKIDVLNTAQFIEFSKDAYNNGYLDAFPGNAAVPNSSRPANYQYPAIYDNPSALADNNYQNEVFHGAMLSNYEVSASGGSDKVTYLLSGNYTDQQGIIKTSSLGRYSFRSNIDAKLSDKLKVGVNLSPTFTTERLANTDGHWLSNAIITSSIVLVPFINIYQPDGSYNSAQSYSPSPYGFPSVTNPIANITEINTRQKTTRILGNAYAEFSFTKDLFYRASIGTDIEQQRIDNFQTSRLPKAGQLPPNINTGYSTSTQNINWIFNQVLDYKHTISSKHNIDVLIGTESQANTNDYSTLNANNFPNDNVTTLNAGTIVGGSTTKEQWALASYFSRVAYNYDNKYLFNLSMRLDGSSRFGSNNRYGFFPAASIGWNIAKENFLKDSRLISTLKIKASYGLSGNNAFGNYQSLGLLSKSNYVLGNAQVNGLGVSSLPNTDLTWEKSLQTDIGIEGGFLADRITFTADYYNRTTDGLLVTVPVPTLTGFSTAVTNIGKIRNRGFEFGLNSNNIVGSFQWITNANFSLNRNIVLALGANGLPITGAPGIGNVITQVGQPIGNFYAYRALGIFQNQAQIDAYPHFSNTKPGDIKFEDVDGNGKIDSQDQTIVGNNQPKFTYGLTNTFAYKGFDLAITLQGVYGGQIFNFTNRFYDSLNGKYNTLTYALNRWKSEADPGDGKTPRANINPTGNNNQPSSRWSEDGSYLNIRNITLGYSLPKSMVNKVKISNARIYLGVQNAHIFSKYTGFNPEVTTVFDPGTAILAGGVDYGAYPQARTFTLGVNVSL